MSTVQDEKFKHVKRLPLPVKGLSDKYEYSMIELTNGLRALIVSDVQNLLSVEELAKCEVENGETVEDELKMDADRSDGESVTSDESQEDGNTDGEKKSEEKLAALSLTVGAGSFNDGPILGLAHFLEHMVFMGSDKYPEENDFDAFLSLKGGSSNASTECEYTTFYFDVPEVHLHKSMDIFSHFFIFPLLKQDSINNEREIVDSEFQNSILNDSCRIEQVMATLCTDSNPAGRFVWGNNETLKTNVDETELYARLDEFRREHYSGHRMTLAVQARLDLSTLENWVVECFSPIPNNQKPKPKFNVERPFRTTDWNQLFLVKPIEDVEMLHLSWVTPPVNGLYKKKPLDVLSCYIGHEGKGSIISYLRNKFLAVGMEAGYEDSGFNSNHIYTIFQIIITLTDKGIDEYRSIVDVVFQYLSLLQANPIDERMFDEIRAIHEMSFNYEGQRSAADYVEVLSKNMQYYPDVDTISGPMLYYEFDADLINEYLAYLSPSTVNIILLSSKLSKNARFECKEKWFGTEYNVTRIDPKWISDWTNVHSNDQLHLPELNPFVPTNFDLFPVDRETKHPELIEKNASAEVWFKQTMKYMLPHCTVSYVFEIPYVKQSIEHSVLFDIYICLVHFTIPESVYAASLAHYNASISQGEYGINMILSGFTQHMEQFLSVVLRHLKTMHVCEEIFKVCAKSVRRRYLNNLKDTDVLQRMLRLNCLLRDCYFGEDMCKCIGRLTFEDFVRFKRGLLDEMYVKCIAIGNIKKSTVLSMTEFLISTLNYKPLAPEKREEIRIHRLAGPAIIRVQSFNPDDPNSTVLNYYQSKQNDGSLRESCVIEILVEIIQEPLFDTLRTKRKLGYHVNATVRDTFGILGLSLLVESQKSKFSISTLDNELHSFLRSYFHDNMTSLKTKYTEMIATLIKKKKLTDVNLSEETIRLFDEIKINDYLFDRNEREIELIRTIELNEIVDWIEKNVNDERNESIHKLSVQIVGTKVQAETSPDHINKRKISATNDLDMNADLLDRRKRFNEAMGNDSEAEIIQANLTTSDKCATNNEENNELEDEGTESSDGEDEEINSEDESGEEQEEKDSNDEEFVPVLKYLHADDSDRLLYVKDIKQFKQSLDVFPVTKLK